MAAATTKQTDASKAFEAAASEAASQAKDFFDGQIAFSEKSAKAGFELMSESYKLSQGLVVEGYRNMVTNTAAYFDGMKALTKTKDAAEFSKVAQEQMIKGYEALNEQGQSYMQNANAAVSKTMEAGREAMDETFGK